MKYLFKNIGPIKNAELELGDLTVIAGGNNTGKTYIVYALYGLLEQINSLQGYSFSRGRYPIPPLRQMEHILQIEKRYMPKLSEVENQGNVFKGKIPMKTFHKYVENALGPWSSLSTKELAKIFSAPRNKFSNSAIGIMVEAADFPKGFSFSDTTKNAKVKLSEKNGFIEYEVELKTNDMPWRDPRPFHFFFLMQMVWEKILKISPNFILPADRFGIYLFRKELDFTKSRLVEMLQGWSHADRRQRKSEIPLMIGRGSARYSIPIRDHIDWTRELDDVVTSPSSENKLFDNIKDMMGGYYKYDDDEIFFVSRARGKNRYEIPLHIASSSARGLSGLYFHLKHRNSHVKKLLIVDEPESHLDTKNQIKIARLLGECVNAGMRVLITTHSDYIVQELNNMIMLNSVPDNEKIRQICKKRYDKKNHALDKSRVKGYLCQNGELKPCEVNDRGINLEWFEETINDINGVSDTFDSHLPEKK